MVVLTFLLQIVYYKCHHAEGKNSNLVSLKTKYKPVKAKKRPVPQALQDGSIPYQWDEGEEEATSNPARFRGKNSEGFS
jgi:hypothetical protein